MDEERWREVAGAVMAVADALGPERQAKIRADYQIPDYAANVRAALEPGDV